MSRPEPLPLRPHHGLCTAFFQGKGYSPAFADNLAQVIGTLEGNPEVVLTAAPDGVCACCPNCGPEGCASAEKVLGYDRAVLALCGLTEGQHLPAAEFRALTEERILRPGRREEICGDCQWTALCK